MTNGVGGANWRRLGDGLGRRLLPLNGRGLLVDAQRRTRLEDFGEPNPEPALSTLVDSLESEAQLHPVGRLLMRIHLRDLLETRLRLNAAWENIRDRLENSPLQRPVFIVGMPRSGSTFLHELLGEDPATRAPRVWEVMFPLRTGPLTENERQRRIRKAEACLWWFRKLARQADAVYPMRACTPHECVAIHSYTFLSEEFVSTCRIPTYETFLRSADRSDAYRWQKRFLQALQYGCEPKRWVMKSPDHAHSLKGLFSAFPDAMIIQTHRNPFEVLRSSAELTRVLQGLYGWPGDPDQLAAREARVLAEGTERFISFRDEHPELADRFIDLKYVDLISDPLTAVAQIYQRLNVPLTDEAVNRMRCLASQRSRYHRAVRRPTTARHHPAPTRESRRFEHYCSRFGLNTQSAE
jgi:Sulfotransferase family